MTNAITEAKSIEEVAAIINAATNGESPTYFGGKDNRTAEEMTGQYAWEAAKESGYIDDANIEAQLYFLSDAGAKFNFTQALENALARRKT